MKEIGYTITNNAVDTNAKPKILQYKIFKSLSLNYASSELAEFVNDTMKCNPSFSIQQILTFEYEGKLNLMLWFYLDEKL